MRNRLAEKGIAVSVRGQQGTYQQYTYAQLGGGGLGGLAGGTVVFAVKQIVPKENSLPVRRFGERR